MALQRISLTDTTTRERLFFQFAPESLEENIDPQYKKVLPLMGSRQTSFYMGTKSEVVPLELFFTLIGARRGVGSSEAFPDLEQIESIAIANPLDFESLGSADTRPSLEGPARFLKSLCYNDPDISRGGLEGIFAPPRLVLDWPGILALEGHIESLRIRYKQFDTRDLRGLVMVATMNFVEDFDYSEVNDDERIRRSKVRTMGSNRANRRLIPRARGVDEAIQPQTVVFTRDLTG